MYSHKAVPLFSTPLGPIEQVCAGNSWPDARSYLATVDDEIAALTQQLEEIRHYRGNCKGKYKTDDLPDTELVVSAYQDELSARINFLHDLKVARSIARAIDLDSQLIANVTQCELQAQGDRQFAMEMSTNDPDLESPRFRDDNNCCNSIIQKDSFCTASQDRADASEEEVAGPSTTHVQRQRESTMKFAQIDLECCVCCDHLQPNRIVSLSCGHYYCNTCLKDLFMKATKDESLFPPRCCRQHIPLTLVQPFMSEDEYDMFKGAEVEFSTADRMYCSNVNCGRFITPREIQAGKAECNQCGFSTCAMCKSPFHEDDCASDTALQATLALATSQGWQRCFGYKALVELRMGCYHMTCKCRSQFCYLCSLIAEEVVDREATHPLAPQERQLRIEQMRDDLRENHECEHPGRFERLFDGGRRGFECEMCGDRHRKYILQCRRCHIRVCEDCRRHRV
ncbi:hypothetical protein BDV24DRAFT_156732 [Aspergillus arachidicola]|uniref:RBR-type E3 ubiquitin transferase n=1 Tax=Aspergillus arachidicola TaxID=656916 RepID=A0A5N6XN46_9EURO|nr:hypothetical protein BDV24DRAFT_156732 [Aspergillus arachidicola]